MEITPAALRALQTQFSGLFYRAYDRTVPWYQQLCTSVPSSAKQNDYGWMAKSFKMREWVGERQSQNLFSHHYAITNKLWELTVDVDRSDIDDDNLGIYNPRFELMGEEVRKQPDDVLTGLLQNGHNELCFDQQAFFDTDHPVNIKKASMGVQSNYSANGMALNQPNFETVRMRMMGYKGEDGRPLRVNPTHIIVPPALGPDARKVLQADLVLNTAVNTGGSGLVAAGVSNTTKGMAGIIELPELAGQDTTWYMADLSKVVKPFVYQNRRAPTFVSHVNPSDESVFRRNSFEYGVDKRDNAGYALWFLAYKAAA